MATQSGCVWQTYTPQPLDPGITAARFESHSLEDPGLKEFLAGGGHATVPWPLPAWDLPALTLAAHYYHPGLALARAEAKVAEARRITAGARPNPGFDANVEHHSDTPDEVTPWSIGAALGWVFEPPAKRAARLERAQARAAAAGREVQGRQWAIRGGVRDRFIDLDDAGRRAEQLREQIALLDDGVKLLSRRLDLGEASAFEVSNMRLEAQRVRLALIDMDAKIAGARAGLAGAMALPLSALRGVEYDFAAFRDLPGVEAGSLQHSALTQRADVLRGLEEYAAAEAALKEEVARQYPDLTLSPGYFFDQTDQIWRLGASLVLPLLDRNEGPIAEASARREAEARRFEALQAAVIGELQQALVLHLAALQSMKEADRLIGALEEHEDKVRREVELGEGDRLALVRAQMETAEARGTRQELLTRAWRALAQVEDAAQVPLLGAVTGIEHTP